jgi:beta-glucosidase
VEYRESVFVGYRYYNTADKPVAYPFGYGLSYTSFEYSDLTLSAGEFKAGGSLELSFTVTNTGSRPGTEVAQIYVAPESSKIFRPRAELKGFEKLRLEKGERKTVRVCLDTRSFAYYHVPSGTWALEGGTYNILVGTNCRDIRLRGSVAVAGDGREADLADIRKGAPEYFALGSPDPGNPGPENPNPENSDLGNPGTNRKGLTVSDTSFRALYGRPLPAPERLPGEPFSVNSTIRDIQDTPPGQALLQQITAGLEKSFGAGNDDIRPMIDRMLMDMPLRSLSMFNPQGMPPGALEAIVNALNGGEMKSKGENA